MENVILVDCDGVLVDWASSFMLWMKKNGYTRYEFNHYDIAKSFRLERPHAKSLVKHFNESAHIGWMPPFRDAIKYIKKLHEEHGFVFHCITSLSEEPNAWKLRDQNLRSLFGETAFEKLVCLPCGADKDEGLKPYRDSGCIWVEDKPENAILGVEYGLRSFLIEHEYNKNFHNQNVQKVTNWSDLYSYIV